MWAPALQALLKQLDLKENLLPALRGLDDDSKARTQLEAVLELLKAVV